MALITTSPSSHRDSPAYQFHRLPQNQYVDALRWLPQLSPLHRHVILANFDTDSSISSLQTLSFSPSSFSNPLTHQATQQITSRVTSLKTFSFANSPKPFIAASTFSGNLSVFSADLFNGSLHFEFSVPEKGFHSGRISGIDVSESGIVSVGEDGRVNLTGIGHDGRGSFMRVFDSKGLVSYNTVKWASNAEFLTGGLGFSLHWWDQRKPGGPVNHFKGNWTNRTTSGIIHSVDIHQAQKHMCLAGGSSGTVFVWDRRWEKQPIILSGTKDTDVPMHSLFESDVWEVQYDNYTHSSYARNNSASGISPAMICSEDGILAVIEQSEEPKELLAEPCYDDDDNRIQLRCSDSDLGWADLDPLTFKGTVSYCLLLDNRSRVSNGYLGTEFQVSMEMVSTGLQLMPTGIGKFVGLDYEQVGPTQSRVDEKWALGLQSKSPPHEIMTEVLKALHRLNIGWKRIGHYNMKCRWSLDNNNASQLLYVVKFEVQVCVWCWHQIMDMAEKDESEGRCPACRSAYEKDKIVAM